MKKLFTLEQEQYIRENYKNKSYKEIAEDLGNFTERQVRGWVNNSGLRKNRIINDTYFSEIDTPLKAYLLGFIYADGWVIAIDSENKRNYEFGMQLQSEDKYILDKINSELGGVCPIIHHNPYEHYICGIKTKSNHSDCIRVYSKPFVMSLIKNGVESNKSKKDVYPIVTENLFFDWLRGYIDGDGCYYTSKKTNHLVINITCASYKPLEYIKNKLEKYNIKTSIYKEKDNKYRLVCFNYNSVISLVNKLYYNSSVFCLKRKYEKIKHLLGLAA